MQIWKDFRLLGLSQITLRAEMAVFSFLAWVVDAGGLVPTYRFNPTQGTRGLFQ